MNYLLFPPKKKPFELLLPKKKKTVRSIDSSAKSRPKKPEQVVAALRKLQKDTTRRRFFRECCKPDSVLWAPPVSGSKAEMLRAELFDKAAEDPLNLIFAENPGATRNVTGVQLRKIIR